MHCLLGLPLWNIFILYYTTSDRKDHVPLPSSTTKQTAIHSMISCSLLMRKFNYATIINYFYSLFIYFFTYNILLLNIEDTEHTFQDNSFDPLRHVKDVVQLQGERPLHNVGNLGYLQPHNARPLRFSKQHIYCIYIVEQCNNLLRQLPFRHKAISAVQPTVGHEKFWQVIVGINTAEGNPGTVPTKHHHDHWLPGVASQDNCQINQEGVQQAWDHSGRHETARHPKLLSKGQAISSTCSGWSPRSVTTISMTRNTLLCITWPFVTHNLFKSSCKQPLQQLFLWMRPIQRDTARNVIGPDCSADIELQRLCDLYLLERDNADCYHLAYPDAIRHCDPSGGRMLTDRYDIATVPHSLTPLFSWAFIFML